MFKLIAPRRKCVRSAHPGGGSTESQPDDVARQDIEALLDGKDHVYAASTKVKLEGMLANVTPGAVKGAMHEKMAPPKPTNADFCTISH